MQLCFLAGALSVSLMSDHATLAWAHSVEKLLWEEDWRATRQGLVLETARVRGSGAGMEAGPDAVFRDGVWSWKPKLPPLEKVTLRRSGTTADWRICRDDACRPLSELVPEATDPVVLTTCADQRPIIPDSESDRRSGSRSGADEIWSEALPGRNPPAPSP